MPCIVHSLVGHAGCESAISHHGNHVMRLALQIAGRRHAKSGGHRSTGMTGAELIMLALVAAEKSRETAFLPQCGESIVAPGENFPRVSLMPHIP